jgi:hypothetical protein
MLSLTKIRKIARELSSIKELPSMRPLILMGIFLLVLGTLAEAHLDAGSDDVVNGYMIDYGYSPVEPNNQNSTFINFNVLDNATQKVVNITEVWVRISDEKKTVFAGSFKPTAGNVGFSFTFPHTGNFDMMARFYNGSQILAEHTYTFEVDDPAESRRWFIDILSIVLISGGILVYIVLKTPHKRS